MKGYTCTVLVVGHAEIDMSGKYSEVTRKVLMAYSVRVRVSSNFCTNVRCLYWYTVQYIQVYAVTLYYGRTSTSVNSIRLHVYEYLWMEIFWKYHSPYNPYTVEISIDKYCTTSKLISYVSYTAPRNKLKST